MTITNRVQGAFFRTDAQLIRLAPNAPPSKGPTRRQGRPWTNEEHDRFLHAMEIFPSGPWKNIAAHVGTRTTRQTMTHAQKYRQKIERWKRGASTKLSATPATSTTTAVPPSSPAAPEEIEVVTDEAEEDAMFWQAVQDILDETSTANSTAPMFHQVELSATQFEANEDQLFTDFISRDEYQLFENYAAVV